MITLYILFIFFTYFFKKVVNIQYSYTSLEETMGTEYSLDLCFIKCLEQQLDVQNSARIPQIILTPNATHNQQFDEFVWKISQSNTVLPHLIYNDVEKITIEKSHNVMLFISSSDEITPTFLDKLRNSHARIYIIYSNENIKFWLEIREIFDLLPRHEFSLVT